MTRAAPPGTFSIGDSPLLEEAPELREPLALLDPPKVKAPLVLSSPHSGHVYPASFLAVSRLDATTLRRSEDMYVDELVRGAAAEIPLLSARFPRAYLDVNREPYELDPRMFEGRLPPQANVRSMRVAGGLGTIARIVGESQEIYARRLPVAAAMARIEALYHPYHRMLRLLLGRALDSHGVAVLVDCHSMPSTIAAAGGGERIRTDIVLGDRHGTSCDPSLMDALEMSLREAGYSVQRNKPYAGGHITEYYGRPATGVHALQIEINRALYMSEATFARKPEFPRVAADLTAAIARLGQAAAALLPPHRAAAE